MMTDSANLGKSVLRLELEDDLLLTPIDYRLQLIIGVNLCVIFIGKLLHCSFKPDLFNQLKLNYVLFALTILVAIFYAIAFIRIMLQPEPIIQDTETINFDVNCRQMVMMLGFHLFYLGLFTLACTTLFNQLIHGPFNIPTALAPGILFFATVLLFIGHLYLPCRKIKETRSADCSTTDKEMLIHCYNAHGIELFSLFMQILGMIGMAYDSTLTDQSDNLRQLTLLTQVLLSIGILDIVIMLIKNHVHSKVNVVDYLSFDCLDTDDIEDDSTKEDWGKLYF